MGRHAWGEHRTVRYPREAVSSLGMPPVGANALMAGLPNAVTMI